MLSLNHSYSSIVESGNNYYQANQQSSQMSLSCIMGKSQRTLLKTSLTFQDRCMQLNIFLNKSRLQQLINGFLTQRSQVDREQSLRQVFDEHKMFRILRVWKRLVRFNREKQLQAQIMQQTRKHKVVKMAWKEWRKMVENKKQALKYNLNRIFQAFKLVALNDLSIRLRRIQLSQKIICKRLKEFIENIKKDNRSDREIINQHRKTSIQSRFFKAWQARIPQLKLENIKTQQQQLAILFYRQKRQSAFFNSWKNPESTSSFQFDLY